MTSMVWIRNPSLPIAPDTVIGVLWYVLGAESDVMKVVGGTSSMNKKERNMEISGMGLRYCFKKGMIVVVEKGVWG